MPILGGCLCCDLKVGTTVLGVFHLISALFATLGLLGALMVMSIFSSGADLAHSDLQSQLDKLNKDIDDFTSSLDYNDDREIAQNQQEFMKLIQEHLDKALIVIYIFLALAILKVITTSMLIHGVRRDRRGFLLPFIVHETLLILCVIGLVITMFVFLGANKITGAFAASIVISVLIGIYCILVVVSQYQALGLIRMHEEICMK